MPISPVYIGQLSPTWREQPTDDEGRAEDFTGMVPADFSVKFINMSNEIERDGTGTINVITEHPALVEYIPSSDDIKAVGLFHVLLWANLRHGPKAYSLGIVEVLGWKSLPDTS